MNDSTTLLDLVDALAAYADRRARAVSEDGGWAGGHARDLLGHDRRAHVRRRPTEFDHALVARLKAGPVLRLLDVSAGGALIETPSRLTPGAQILVEFLAPATREATLVRSRVMRSHVAALDGGVRYRGACSFDGLLELAALVNRPGEPRSPVVDAIEELRPRIAAPSDPADAAVASLLDDVTRLARMSEPRAALTAHVDAWLRQRVPLLALRLRRARRRPGLDVEFHPACALDSSQKRLLDAGATILRVLCAG
jgi:hypothetical protein